MGSFGGSGIPNNSWTFTSSEITRNGDTTSGNGVITNLSSTSDLRVGFPVSGTGIGASAKISSIDSSSQVTLDVNSTITDTGVSITFDCQFVVPTGVSTVLVDICGGGKGGKGDAGDHGDNGGTSSFGSYVSAAGANATYGSMTNNGQGFATDNNGASAGSTPGDPGGAGVFYNLPVSVTAGESIDITIGTGGQGGTGNTDHGQDGADGICVVKWIG